MGSNCWSKMYLRYEDWLRYFWYARAWREGTNVANLDIRRFELCVVLCLAADIEAFWFLMLLPHREKESCYGMLLWLPSVKLSWKVAVGTRKETWDLLSLPNRLYELFLFLFAKERWFNTCGRIWSQTWFPGNRAARLWNSSSFSSNYHYLL